MEFKINNVYKHNDIIDYISSDESIDYREYGSEIIGEFILQVYEKDKTLTFILDSTVRNYYLMKLVYII